MATHLIDRVDTFCESHVEPLRCVVISRNRLPPSPSRLTLVWFVRLGSEALARCTGCRGCGAVPKGARPVSAMANPMPPGDSRAPCAQRQLPK